LISFKKSNFAAGFENLRLCSSAEAGIVLKVWEKCSGSYKIVLMKKRTRLLNAIATFLSI